MPREMKYETAMRQLETIAEKMENGELDIDSLCVTTQDCSETHKNV